MNPDTHTGTNHAPKTSNPEPNHEAIWRHLADTRDRMHDAQNTRWSASDRLRTLADAVCSDLVHTHRSMLDHVVSARAIIEAMHRELSIIEQATGEIAGIAHLAEIVESGLGLDDGLGLAHFYDRPRGVPRVDAIAHAREAMRIGAEQQRRHERAMAELRAGTPPPPPRPVNVDELAKRVAVALAEQVAPAASHPASGTEEQTAPSASTLAELANRLARTVQHAEQADLADVSAVAEALRRLAGGNADPGAEVGS